MTEPEHSEEELSHIEEDLRPLAVAIDGLLFDERQVRKHGTRSIAEIKRSLKKHGQKKPIVVHAATNQVKAGNGTLTAAKELGLVTHVSDKPLEHAMELAGEIASKSPDAVRYGKQLFESTWHSDARTGLELEASLQSKLIGSDNQVEAIRANFEKRAPNFKPAQ